MEKNKMIVVILVAIIIALLVCIFAVMSNSNKVDSKLEIMGNDTLNEGDNLQVKLTDVNGTALVNQSVNVTITDENKTSDYHSVVTNEEGVGSLKLEKSAGKYNVTISYSGNDNYSACNATKKITLEKVVEEPETKVTSTNSNDEIEGPEYDSLGISKEQAMRAEQSSGRDVKYDAESGLYVQYDPKYGTYHT